MDKQTIPGRVPDWLSLAGTAAVVTGGGTHLGRAMATALGELGAAVHLVGRRAEVVSKAAEELRDRGIDATSSPGDAADESTMERVVEAVVERHGRLDTMVCNAGGAQGRQPPRELACELAEYSIRVNCISPGPIPKSNMDAETAERIRHGVPLGRPGTPDDLKGAVTLFATGAGSWITGQNLYVDGGWSAW